MRKNVLYFVLAVSFVLSGPVVAGPTYSFQHVSEEGDTAGMILNGLTGEAQLFVEVSKPFADSEQTLFTFTNTGPEICFIGGIYFYDGDILLQIAALVDNDETIGSLIGDPDVDFEENTKFLNDPKKTKGPGGIKGLVSGFAMVGQPDADKPGSLKDGVDQGEFLGVLFDLTSDSTYMDVLAGLDTGSIVIGLHVQGFDDDGSEGFVNNGQIPAPGALLLGGIGAVLVGWIKRMRSL